MGTPPTVPDNGRRLLRRRARRGRAGWAALLAAVAALLVACTSPEERVADAEAATAAAGSARVSVSTDVQGLPEDLAMALAVGADGEVDFDAGRGRLQFSLPGLEEAAPDALEVVFDGTSVYSQIPLPGGDAWFELDLSEDGLLADAGGLAPGTDPRGSLGFLRGAVSVEEVGDAEVDGEETTELDVIVDLAAARDAVDDDLRPAIDDLLGDVDDLQLPVTVWLDDDDRVRRLSYEIGFAAGELSDEPVAVRVTLAYSDFGLAVDAEPPPPEAIVDPDELDELFGPGLDDLDGDRLDDV